MELKFRGYHPVLKEMFFFDMWIPWEVESKNGDTYYTKNMDIKQFTGLTDNNGADSYEGDIIRYWDLYECHSDAVDYFGVEPENNFPVHEVFFELKTGVIKFENGAFKVNGICIFDIGSISKDRVIENYYMGNFDFPLKEFVYDCYERGVSRPLSKGLSEIETIGNIHQNPELLENKQ
jgi:hypothetical protein